MSDNNTNNQNEECLRDNWADFGKGMGNTFSGLGKSLVQTAKVGLNAASDWVDGNKVDNTAEKQQVKEGWKNFGHSFVDTAEDFGKASVRTVKKGVDKVDNATDRGSNAEPQAEAAQAPEQQAAAPSQEAPQAEATPSETPNDGFVKSGEGEFKEL